MKSNKQNLINKIIYRSQYRGTKEMDLLLSVTLGLRKKHKLKNFKNTEHMHFYSLYVGNYPDLKKNKILKLCKILNEIRV